MNEFIDIPYIVFPFGKATPAFVLFVAYVVLLLMITIYAKKRNIIIIHNLLGRKYLIGIKKQIILSMSGLMIGSAICWEISTFFEKEKFLMEIFERYLQYEPIIAIAIFLFFCSTLFTEKNKDMKIAATNKFVLFILPFSIMIGLVTRQIDISYSNNCFALVFVYIVYFMLLIFKSERVKNKSELNIQKNNYLYDANAISYNPVENVEQLFPQHRAQAEHIANIILFSSSDPFSICLTGEWGTGKTSVIRGVEELLKNNKKGDYAFIHLNATELDNKKSLINYFMSEVKSCLKERGVYVGIASEYEEFLVSTVGTLTTGSLGRLVQKKLFDGEKDYRDKKEKLENLIEITFEKGKIVLIVDDVERCEADVARDYLFFIKEVATMKNCVSVFVTDHEVLQNLIMNDSKNKNSSTYGENKKFLDKFFNRTINLYDEAPEDILDFLNNSYKNGDPVFSSTYELVTMAPGKWYQQVYEKMNNKIVEQEKKFKESHFSNEEDEKIQKNKLDDIIEIKTLFVQSMQHPRSVVRFYNACRTNMLQCYKKLFQSGTVRDENDIRKFVNQRNIGYIVFLFSFIEIYFPEELHQIKKMGENYLDPPFYGDSSPISKERGLLIEIAKITIYEDYSSRKKEYMRTEINTFITKFLEPNAELHQLIKTFTTQEEEWIDAIDKNTMSIIKDNWNEMIRMLISKNPNVNDEITDQWKQNKFSHLLELSKQNNLPTWEVLEIEKLFSIFEDDKKGRLFAQGIGLMQIFWDYLQNVNVKTVLSKKIKAIMDVFSRNYAYERVYSTYQLFQCIVPYDNKESNKDIRVQIRSYDRTFEENLLCFTNQIIEYIPNFRFENEGWFNNYRAIVKYLLDYLIKYEFLEYKDTLELACHMIDSENELKCLTEILKWVQVNSSADNSNMLTENDYSNIDKTIRYFEEKCNKEDQYRDMDLESQFWEFFKYLRDYEKRVNNQQIKQLHNLVTLYVEKTGDISLPYRKILLHKSIQNEKYENTKTLYK